MKLRYPGLIQDTFDPRDVWADEIGLAGAGELPEKFLIEGLNYEVQGFYPFCVSFATTTIIESKYRSENSVNIRLSQPHLFFHSGGGVKGSNFRYNLNTALDEKKGCISWVRMPMPNPYTPFPNWLVELKRDADAIPFTDTKRIAGYVRVNNDVESLKQALLAHGPLLVGVDSKSPGYYTGKASKRKNSIDDHAVVLAGWNDEDNTFIRFDSLGHANVTDGYVAMSQDYPFITAYAITELPEDWREQRDVSRKTGFEICLNHYGKPRDYARELQVAADMVREFQKFNNQSVWEAASKFWTVYINAIAYGGYSLSYKKFGIWQSGDVINDCYNWRRTGKNIFDFNKLRSEHK